MKSSATSAETQPSVHASAWPLVPLGEILTQRSPDVRVEPTGTYQFAGVYCFGRGVFRGPLKKGNEFAYPVLTRLCAGEFVYPKLMAWEGAFGVVPDSCDGFFVSPEFPVFEPDKNRLIPRFIELFFKTSQAWDSLSATSTGTNVRRRRLHPSQLLRQTIPLPSLEQQHRIIVALDSAGKRIRQAREHLATQLADAETLLIRLAHRQDLSRDEKLRDGWRDTELGKALTLALDPVEVETDREYSNLGIYCFGKGLFDKPPISGAETSATTLYRVKEGQFIYSRLFAFERAYGIVPKELDGFFVSGEFPVFDLDAERVTPDFLYAYFRLPLVWQRLLEGSKGLGSRRIRVHPEQILAHRLLLPPLAIQKTISAVVRRTNQIKAHAAQITADLDALERSMLAAAFRGELVSAEPTEKTASAQRPSDARTYIVQFVPALLRAADGPLSLEEVARAYALLFQPKIFLPLIEATGGAAARRNFAELPPLDEKVFAQMLQELHRAGVIEQDAATNDLHLGKVSAPPTAAAVAEDARLLAAILTLVPREAVRTMARKLCPKPARELFAALS